MIYHPIKNNNDTYYARFAAFCYTVFLLATAFLCKNSISKPLKNNR